MIIKNTDGKVLNPQEGGYPDQFTTMVTKETPTDIKRNLDFFSQVAMSQYEKNKKYKKDYKLLNGEFDFSDYTSDPFILEMTKYLYDSPELKQELPQHLKHYSILNSPINTQLGELIKRPHKHSVKTVDDIAKDEQIDFRTSLIMQSIMQNLKAKAQGLPPEQAQQQIEKEIQAKVINYTSIAEEWGNKVITALKYHFNFHDKSYESFRDFLTVGKQFHHFFKNKSRLGFEYRVENPCNVWYLGHKNAKTTKQCWAIGTAEILDFPEILDRFDLTEEEIENLRQQNPYYTKNTGSAGAEYTLTSPSMPNPNDPNFLLSLQNTIEDDNDDFIATYQHSVITAYYVSHRPIFKRNFIDEEGYPQSDLVSEKYKLNKEAGDTSLEKTWENIIMKGLKIGNEVYQSAVFEEVSELPIIGIVNTSRNTQGKSPLQLMKPLQILYNVAVNQIWELLEKEIGVVFLGDLKVIPDSDSEDPIAQAMGKAKDRGAIFIDTSIANTGEPIQFNQLTRIDLGRAAEISSRIQIAQWAKSEAWALVGVNDQRVGSIAATETATGTNTAITQSYAQTEPWFAMHENLLRDVYQTMLDMAQYIELKKPESVLNYLNNDLESVFLRITQNELLRDLQIFVTHFAEDREMLDHLKSLTQPAMQNGADLLEIADMLRANSERHLMESLEKMRENRLKAREEEMAMKNKELDQTKEQFQIKTKLEEDRYQQNRQDANLNKQLDRENKIIIEKLQGIANESSYSDQDLTPLLMDQTKLALEQSRHNFEKTVKNKELEQKDRELDIKDKAEDIKLKVAKENKTKAELTRKRK